jgi:hypothetical protein
MADLTGHAAGNGGHSQGTPTAHRALLYSDISEYATYQALTSPRVDVRKALALDSTQIGECVYLKTDRFPRIHGFTKAITRFLPRRN